MQLPTLTMSDLIRAVGALPRCTNRYTHRNARGAKNIYCALCGEYIESYSKRYYITKRAQNAMTDHDAECAVHSVSVGNTVCYVK
jgi:hypothetical protein